MKREVVVLTLAFSLLAASGAFAQADLGLKNIGIAVGHVSPENMDGTFSFGVFADHGTIAPRFGLESRMDYWSWSESAFGAKSSVNDLTIGARSKFHFQDPDQTYRPYMGVGLGMHFIHAEATIPAMGPFPAMTVEDSQTKLGLDLGGGMAARIGPRADLLTELWYGIISDVSQLSLRFGLAYRLGTGTSTTGTGTTRKTR